MKSVNHVPSRVIVNSSGKYLCVSSVSNPGVAGRLASCTVSSVGAAPLTPLAEPFIINGA